MRLKMMMTYCVGLFLLLTVLPAASLATVPQQINYQGYLADSSGNPVPDGNYGMSFAIYNAPTGGTELWSESQTIAVKDGVYNVILGQPGNTLIPDIFDGDRYLGVTIGTDAEMTPRQKLTATAYAMRAARADSVADGAVTSVMLANGAVDANKVADNAITSAKIADSSITAADITGGPGSGLNADMLDGMDSTEFAETTHSHSFSDISGTATDAQIPNNITINHASTADSATFATIADNSTNADNADMVDGQHASAFAASSHTHSGNDITSGTVADARIASSIARDSEIMTTVKNNDGSGSGLDADLLDGKHANGFAASIHDHVGEEWSANIAWSSGAFKVYNYGNGPSIWGWNGGNGNGIRGYALGSGLGVYGESIDNAGVMGRSSTGNGVEGYGGKYDFYAGGTGINYGPFTGAHEVRLAEDFPLDVTPGMIVAVTGKTETRFKKDGLTSLSSTLPTVRLSSVENDKTVFGVLVSEGPLPKDHWYKAGEGERFAVVNALGEGRVWVTNINGDIEAGDYITSSNISGYGQMQDDDLVHSYTVGKATESVNWDSVTGTVEMDGKKHKVYLIAVVYTSG